MSSLISVYPIIFAAIQNMTDNPKLHIDQENELQLTEQETKKVNSCAHNLLSIGNALKAYEKKHNIFPEWLSDLHPNYLKDSGALICPADLDQGIPIIPYDTDPTLPVSYNYDCDPEYYQQ